MKRNFQNIFYGRQVCKVMKTKIKILSLLLCMTVAFSLCPQTAYGEENAVVSSQTVVQSDDVQTQSGGVSDNDIVAGDGNDTGEDADDGGTDGAGDDTGTRDTDESDDDANTDDASDADDNTDVADGDDGTGDDVNAGGADEDADDESGIIDTAGDTDTINVEDDADASDEEDEDTETDPDALIQVLSVDDLDADILYSVGGQGYDDLDDAYDAAIQSGKTLVIEKDIETFYLSVDQTLTIDFNGHTVSAYSGYPAFWVDGSGNLTLTGSGTVNGGDYSWGIIYIGDGSNVTLNDNVILQNNSADSYGGAVYNNGTFNMNGGIIQDTSAKWYGGAIYNNGTFNMNGGTIQRTVSETYSSSAGGAIYNKGVIKLNDGQILECKAASGGGIYLKSGSLEMTGGTITGCSASVSKYGYTVGGGGVYVGEDATFTMQDGEIVKNSSLDDGGGVSNDGEFYLSGGLISQNSAVSSSNTSQNGGGVYNAGSMEMSGGIVTRNIGNGGIYSGNDVDKQIEIKITGGAVFNNSLGKPLSSYLAVLENVDLVLNKNSDAYTSVIAASDMKADGYSFGVWELNHPNHSGSNYWLETAEISGTLPPSSEYTYVSTVGAVYYTAKIAQQPDVTEGDGIYLNGTSGSDSNGGDSSADAVRTFERAKSLAEARLADNPDQTVTIYVCGEVAVNNTSEWSLPDNVILQRMEGYTGYLVNVKRGAKLTLKDITIDGNRPGANTKYTKSLIYVAGTLNIEEGAVLQNNLAGDSTKTYEGGAVYCDGTGSSVNMTGGIIRNNESRNYGGGITISQGSFTMTGGSIEGNRSTSGGGVSVIRGGDITLEDGALITKNYAYDGGGIHIGGNSTAEACGYGEQMLTMNGGTISENEAGLCGGGIFIQMNSVATINAGHITDNGSIYAGNRPFRGGGIYVNGGKYAGFDGDNVKNGLLQLYNVEIADNTAGSSGGGLAACPTANVSVYLTNGGIFHGNKGTSASEIFVYESSSTTTDIYISDFMLGGGMYQWYWDTSDSDGTRADQDIYQHNGDYIYLGNVCHKDDIAKAQKLAKVFITGNYTTEGTYGGGIATNGDVVIGGVPNEGELDAKITITKSWDDNDDEFGERPNSITADIQYGEYTLRAIELTAENGWTTTLENMPDVILQQNNPEVKLIEIECEEYTAKDIKTKIDSKGVLNISFTNEYTPTKGSLTVSKTVSGEGADAGKAFTFTVTLDNTSVNGTFGEMDFTDGVAVFTLKHGESRTAKGLPAGTAYVVTESDNDGYTVTKEGDVGTIPVNGAGTAEASFENHKDKDIIPDEPDDPDDNDPDDNDPNDNDPNDDDSDDNSSNGGDPENNDSDDSGSDSHTPVTSNGNGEKTVSADPVVNDSSDLAAVQRETPDTSDANNPALWLVLLLLAGAGAIGTVAAHEQSRKKAGRKRYKNRRR